MAVPVSSVAEIGGGLGHDARDGVRVGRIDWVCVLVGVHNHVEGEHDGGPPVHPSCEEARRVICDEEGHGS